MARTKTKTEKAAASVPTPARKIYDASKSSSRVIRGSYDISRTTTENEKLWLYVDGLSAAEANNPSIRKIIRERARYEVANNTYADGMIDTLAADTIGPEVQIQLGDKDLSNKVENDFASWVDSIKFWKKLRLMRRTKAIDGEVFAMFFTNSKINNRVKLDLKLIECDQVESWYKNTKEDEIDGIRFDAQSNPVAYRILDVHPGDHRIFMKSLSGSWIDAKYIIHYYSELRPGQIRGVSELLPALALFGELRSFTKAVIGAATRAAEFAAVMETDLLPDGMAAELADPITVIEAVRNAIVSLPEGWKLAQLKAEQPATTYEMFKKAIINESGRCISMPYNIAACDSSDYNYASGRLDHQTYDRGIEVERAEIKLDVLLPVYSMWLEEYASITGMTPADKEQVRTPEFHYAGRDHVDPNKEASADDLRLKNGTLTRARYWAKRGADGKRETAKWMQEIIDDELAWNEARKKAGLLPAPFPGLENKQSPAKPAADDSGNGNNQNEEEQ